MSNQTSQATTKPAPRLTLDEWSVLLALAAAALIRLGLIHIPW
jgi:hypothetical protein